MADQHGMSPVERALERLRFIDPPPSKAKRVRCPSPDHEDKRPDCSRYPDGTWYCFACGAKGDALDFYALSKGITIKQALVDLGAFNGATWTPTPKPPETKPARLPQEVKEILMASAEFPLRWETAKLLSLQEPTQIKLDILAGWDALNERGIDIPETLKLTYLIQGVALFRHADPAKAHMPRERNLAVRRLLRELENA